MVKWDGSKWVQLDNREKIGDVACSYYEAKIDSFSLFYVGVGMENTLRLNFSAVSLFRPHN